MNRIDQMPAWILVVLLVAALIAGCTAEVGSDAWCQEMDAKPKGEWSANDAASYGKHCVLQIKPDK